MQSNQQKFLTVGKVNLDIMTLTNRYPQEDSDERCVDQYWQRGGNASNNCTVLSQLGAPCAFMGTLATTYEAKFLVEDFQKQNIDIENCVYHPDRQCPVSVIIVNLKNGSRTILHASRNMPEVTAKAFKKLDLTNYKWIHFEGRPSADEIRGMLRHVDEYNEGVSPSRRITTSVELEKKREPLIGLEKLADYVFIGKEHCAFRGYSNKEEASAGLIEYCRDNAVLICPWGETGAIARTKNGETFNSAIFPPEEVVDTVGAGDTFNAATILSLSRGDNIQDAITFGCQVAGAKVGMKGFLGLQSKFPAGADLAFCGRLRAEGTPH